VISLAFLESWLPSSPPQPKKLSRHPRRALRIHAGRARTRQSVTVRAFPAMLGGVLLPKKPRNSKISLVERSRGTCRAQLALRGRGLPHRRSHVSQRENHHGRSRWCPSPRKEPAVPVGTGSPPAPRPRANAGSEESGGRRSRGESCCRGFAGRKRSSSSPRLQRPGAAVTLA